jgi:D-alanyl-lipoteichoic acid acyltransferase DltB (MBOAT superfamily)
VLFNSSSFVVFFVVVYTTYLALRRHHKAQNAFLLAASLFFYASWDWRFLGLLAISSGIDFVTALQIHARRDQRQRKAWLVVSLTSNLIILGFFKYFNFFRESLVTLLDRVDLAIAAPAIDIALPVGISFYTFQAMSYCIDVYRGHLTPTRSILDYALFITFFPHLVAGPIQRPIVLLPQVTQPRTLRWEQINAGVFLIVWGYLMKVLIADNMALIANPIFDNYEDHRGVDILIGALAFTFQILGDFAGYSDIARGLSKLMGFELLLNFNLPYFAVNPTDFWQRWHISLSTWLRDYLYIPLGGNRGSSARTYRNLMITMLLGGLWHGAAWTFVMWGAFHGAILVIYRLFEKNPEHMNTWSGWFPSPRVAAKMALMFSLTVIGWTIFRSQSVAQAVSMLSSIGIATTPDTPMFASRLLLFALPLIVMQLWQYSTGDLLVMTKRPPWICGTVYGCMVVAIIVFGVRDSVEFIYFQF